MRGWVYVISNKAMPGLVKVGFSMRNPEIRAAELNHTGSPHPYVVDYEILVDYPFRVEQKVHGKLVKHKEGKEWFRCTCEVAIASVKSVVGTDVHAENFKRADRAKVEEIKALEEERLRLEAVFNNQRKEIISRYDLVLKAALPSTNYWVYFSIIFIAIFSAFEVLSIRMPDSGKFIWSALGSFLMTPVVEEYFNDRSKESVEYKSILEKRDAELALIDCEKSP